MLNSAETTNILSALAFGSEEWLDGRRALED
jgi:hypothetical protein